MRYTMLEKQERSALWTRLAAMPDFVEASFAQLTPVEATLPGQGGAFSPVEHCWHLADLEREGYAVRIRRLRDEADPWLVDFDGARIADERRYRSLSLALGLAAFREARLANLASLRALDSAAWLRAGTQAGVGAVALCDIPAMMAEHDAVHRGEIEAWLRER